MAKDKIAIVGSIGCGKTVLLSVLTHRFQKRTEDGSCYSETRNTIAYTERGRSAA